MQSSEDGNRPRWRGQPGFFEIWFLVVFDPGGGRAWWFRYTTFAPAQGEGRATVWAAVFDIAAPQPVRAGKTILPVEAYRSESSRFDIRIGSGALTNGACRGDVDAGGHRIAWELRFTPAAYAVRRAPRLLDYLPLPTQVSHANADVSFAGWVSVDGARHELSGARGVQKHIWGTRRVEELFWLYCPRFAEDADARLEATAVRARRRFGAGLPVPALVPVWGRAAGDELDWCELPALLWNRIDRPDVCELRVQAWWPTRVLTARAWCDPRTLAGWVYRDPAGWDVHVAQSDVASCEAEVATRPHLFAPWRRTARLTVTQGAALEFHAPEPLPGVRYLPW
jgi:hypothetical protein